MRPHECHPGHPRHLIYARRVRLQRRLFWWFGATILCTGFAVMVAMRISSGGSSTGYGREMDKLRAFVGQQFARVWDDAAARDGLAEEMSRTLDLSVVVERAGGQEIGSFGPPCEGPTLRAPVTRGGRTLGSVALCAERYRSRSLSGAVSFFVTLVMLWGASGLIARRLARPIGEVSRVAQQIGAGNFSARAKIGRHHHGEAVALALSINDMAARIERHMAEQRELLATVSHELRTPLSRIRLLVEMARDGAVSEKMLDELEREVVEIDALVGDLLASSRLDFAALSTRPLDAALSAVRALERAGVDVSVLDVEGEGIEVRADATLLGRALSNLLDNAKKHGGGVSALRVYRANDQVVFAVEDRGAGLPEGEEARIFEPFYRRSEKGSLGLGLSLVQRIAEAHGGGAFAENREGGGARVGIGLPVSG